MKSFKTESKKIMEMMINSIYTNKDIFLRELISNASDANDKFYYESLTNGKAGISKNDLIIKITLDKQKRTITVSDNGIGMDKKALEENLGTIAKSGSQEFKDNVEKKDDINIIGQFGVGFYSSFMVADKVEVISKVEGNEKGYAWTSKGIEGYEIQEQEKLERGTDVVLHIMTNENDEYGKYLEEYEIKSLIKKYSDFISYPIKINVEKLEKQEDGKEIKTQSYETINTMIPLWKKNKKDVKKEEYDEFFKSMFSESEEPLSCIHVSLEGRFDYKALMFIPKQIPYNYYAKEYEKGLKLYTNGVLISEKCANLLPDYFSFVKGVVDADLPLNVSRETLQDSNQVKQIAETLEKKIKDELYRLLNDERSKYEEFFKNFGMQLKFAIYKSYGMEKENLQDLLLYYSLKQNKFITLKEYVQSIQKDQKSIYYACGSSKDLIMNIPQVAETLDTGYDVLALSDEIDEFAIKFIYKYENFELVNVTSNKLEDIGDNQASEDKEMLDFITDALKDKVVKVSLSSKLKNYPVALSSEGEITLEMEKTFKKQAIKNDFKANRVLLINKNDDIYKKLKNAFVNDKEKLKDMASVLLSQAEIMAGFEPENPSSLASLVCKLMA